jgi:iron-sulfur cluster repair protein YtfE (RIC family)
MSVISQSMTEDHRRCDELFADAESAAVDNDWARAHSNYDAFREAILHHFRMEEELLFPRFEQQTGMTMGPTQVMRSEHAQMRELFEEMEGTVGAQQQDRFLGLCETLLMLMQQHNAKEEQMLYPMTDQALGDAAAGELLEQMRAL